MRLIPGSLFVSAFLLQDAFGQSMPLPLAGVTKGLIMTSNRHTNHCDYHSRVCMHSIKSWWLVQHNICSSRPFFVPKFDPVRLRSFFVSHFGLCDSRKCLFICFSISLGLIVIGLVFVSNKLSFCNSICGASLWTTLLCWQWIRLSDCLRTDLRRRHHHTSSEYP